MGRMNTGAYTAHSLSSQSDTWIVNDYQRKEGSLYTGNLVSRKINEIVMEKNWKADWFVIYYTANKNETTENESRHIRNIK